MHRIVCGKDSRCDRPLTPRTVRLTVHLQSLSSWPVDWLAPSTTPLQLIETRRFDFPIHTYMRFRGGSGARRGVGPRRLSTMRWIGSIVLFLLLLGVSAVLADAPETGVVSGGVTDAGGAPLPG